MSPSQLFNNVSNISGGSDFINNRPGRVCFKQRGTKYRILDLRLTKKNFRIKSTNSDYVKRRYRNFEDHGVEELDGHSDYYYHG